MTFLEELKTLDRRDIGRWPLAFRLMLVALIFLVATGLLIWYFVWTQQRPELLQAEQKEVELRKEFDTKQRKAANLEQYKVQLAEMERTFGAMLRQLPGKTEVPSLLVDISQTGLAAGLEEKLFQPANEIRRDFYAELPIRIRLTGNYHELGTFVSGIAALPRIVTLHNIEVKPESKDAGLDQLVLDVTAKTYRYLDEDETQEAKPADAKKPAKRKPRT